MIKDAIIAHLLANIFKVFFPLLLNVTLYFAEQFGLENNSKSQQLTWHQPSPQNQIIIIYYDFPDVSVVKYILQDTET